MPLSLPIPVQRTLGAPRPFRSCKDVWSVQYNDRGVKTGDTLKRELVIDYDAATWRSYLPEDNEALAEYPWLRFGGGTCTQNDPNAQLATVVLNYRQFAYPNGEGAPGAPGQHLPDNYIEWSPSSLREPIQRSAKWNTANPDWGGLSLADFWDDEKQAFITTEDAVNNGLAGFTDFVIGSCLVTAHYFSWKQPPDPSKLFGTRAVPPGLADADAKNWLIMTGGVNPQSGFWHMTLLFQFSANTPGPASAFAWVYDAAPEIPKVP